MYLRKICVPKQNKHQYKYNLVMLKYSRFFDVERESERGGWVGIGWEKWRTPILFVNITRLAIVMIKLCAHNNYICAIELVCTSSFDARFVLNTGDEWQSMNDKLNRAKQKKKLTFKQWATLEKRRTKKKKNRDVVKRATKNINLSQRVKNTNLLSTGWRWH